MTEVVRKEQQIPAYLNEACLEKALKNACQTNCNIQLENWQWKFANMIGGNFSSNIYRINGSYKILPSEELLEFDFVIKDMDMEMAENGTNEMIMLNTILPEMERILKGYKIEANSATTNKLAPSCFYIQSNKEHEFYILEDLNTLGYQLGNRYEGLSVTQAKLVMEKIAKFHATSMIYAEKHPDIIAKLKTNEFGDSTPDPSGRTFTKKCMESINEILLEPDEEIMHKMKRFLLKYKDKAEEAVDPAKSIFNVLNHGDLWVNNILFKAEHETKKDVIFVDFQNSYWGSPTCDLNNLLYTSLPLETLQTQRFELLNHYYQTFKSMLESFKYKKIPTWSDLLKEFKRGAVLRFYIALCEFPFCVMSDETAVGFQVKAFIESTEKRQSIYKTPKVQQFIRHAVSHFEEIGLFEE